MDIKKAVCYSSSLRDEDPLAHLRLIGPLRQSGIKIINGIENGQIFPDLVLEGDIVIIQREIPKDFISYQRIIEIAHQYKKPVIFELDDHLFCLPETHPDRQIAKYGSSLLPMFQALMDADLVSVSTPKLKDFAINFNENVFVLPNFFDDNLWQLKTPVLKLSEPETLTIGYMGGITHKPDLEFIAPALIDLSKRYPGKICFQFWGIEPPAEVASLKQVKWSPAISYKYKDFATFFQSQTADIFISPLIDNIFNRCKSPIKFFEYSALGVPGVFSSLETYTDVITHEYNGMLASSLDEWTNFLVQLIEDDQLRFNIAKSAQETIKANWLLSQNSHRWEKAFQRAFISASSRKEQKGKTQELIISINYQLKETINSIESAFNKARGQLIEKDTTLQGLIAQFSDQEQFIHSLSTQVEEQGQTIQSSKDNLAEKDQVVQTLSSLIEEKDQEVQLLSAQVAEKEQIILSLTPQMGEKEQIVRTLTKKLERKERFAQALSMQVELREKELAEIINSKAWKLSLFLRRTRILLVPPNGRLERFLNFLFSLSKKNRKEKPLLEEIALIRSSGLFDENWYLANNPDVTDAKVDPLQHYLMNGGFEGRDPGPNFCSEWYLKTYTDVEKARINPLLHYLKFGKNEGRAVQPVKAIQLTSQVSIGKPPPKAMWLLRKITIAWREGGIPYIWQKTRQKVNWILRKSRSVSVDEQSDLSFTAFSIDQTSPENLVYQPLISVLIPTFNTPGQYLIAAVDSVRHQLYPNWEICICDDASSDKATLSELQDISRKDARIKVIYSQENEGISAATNKAAGIAQGEFFAFLDHDDELTTNALYEMVLVLNEDDGIDVLYSDQDKIDANGIPHEPFFKPDWSPLYLRSVMYVGHLLLVRRELFQNLRGFDSSFDGVQDYEFILRVAETYPQVRHIPKILYHWRKIPGSVAFGPDEKGSKIEILQAKAVSEHISRLGLQVTVASHPKHRHRVVVQPKPRSVNPLVSIIILTKDAPEHIGRCLQSIFEKSTYPDYEIIVVDNGTTDPDALQILNKYPVKVISFPEKFNFSKANNLGVKNSEGEFIVLLNNDTEVVNPDWIEQLLFYCEMPEIGAVGPLLIYPNRTVQHAGVVLGFRGTADHVMRQFPSDSDGYAGSLSCPREVTSVTAACLMMKRHDYLEAGGLIEYYGTHYQDVDLCLRIQKKGKRNLYVPYAVLIHYEGSTRGKFYDHMDRALLLDIWGDLIAKGDPFYNPNFSLTNQEFYAIKQ